MKAKLQKVVFYEYLFGEVRFFIEKRHGALEVVNKD